MTSPALAAAIEHWDGLLADDDSLGDSLPELREWMLARGLQIEDRPLCTVLRPHLVTVEDMRRQTQLAEHVIGAIEKVRAALLEDRDLHFIELNADMPQSMGHNDGLVAFFQQLGAYDRFAERYRIHPLRLEQNMLD